MVYDIHLIPGAFNARIHFIISLRSDLLAEDKACNSCWPIKHPGIKQTHILWPHKLLLPVRISSKETSVDFFVVFLHLYATYFFLVFRAKIGNIVIIFFFAAVFHCFVVNNENCCFFEPEDGKHNFHICFARIHFIYFFTFPFAGSERAIKN